MSTPPEHALRLIDAFRRWTDPVLIAEIGEGWLPDSYRPHYGGAAFKATNSFLERLARRELILWAREGTPLGAWAEVPARAWPDLLRVKDWRRGIVGCAQHKSGFVMRAGLAIDNDVSGRVLSLKRYAVPGQVEGCTYYYDARVTLAADIETSTDEPAAVSKRMAVSEFEEWYLKERVDPFRGADRPPSRDEDWAAAKAQFGDRVAFTMLRAAREKLQPVKNNRGRPKFGRN